MTHFPQRPAFRPAKAPAGSGASSKPGLLRDLVWGRPVFKAPALKPSTVFEALPFSPAHVPSITRREPRQA